MGGQPDPAAPVIPGPRGRTVGGTGPLIASASSWRAVYPPFDLAGTVTRLAAADAAADRARRRPRRPPAR
ncbi:hypothetical protein [Streptomyces sp. NBC_01361]|uniref:hypothetical protein n=1 Tax=Streptomyces sp. NBC_01361 TaxID=2903838 RepID=UPI002E36D724|nr:hypothetical protein [Streptomyces sp. NBC_01361]